MKSGELSNKVSNMSFVAAWMVVAIHLGEARVHGSPAWWFLELTKNGICQIAVPFFFIVSGYFLAKDYDWKVAIRKRIRSLLIPYFLWSAVFVLFSKTLQFVANLRAHRELLDNIFVVDQMWTWFGIDFFQLPYCVPYWYLRTLMLLIIISPVLIWFARQWPATSLCLFFMLGLFRTPELLCLQWFPLFFFCVGLALRINVGEFKIPRRLFVVSCVLSLVLFAVSTIVHYYESPFARHTHTIMLLFMIIALFGIIPGTTWPKILTQSSFAIYIIHSFILSCTGIVWPSAVDSCYGLVIRWIIAAAGSMAFTVVVNRSRGERNAILRHNSDL